MKKQVSLTALALATALSATAAHAGDVQVKGKVYFDYSKHTATGKANETAGDIKRTYITIKKKVDDVWSTRVTLDSSIDGSTKKSNNVFLKYAYLKGKFSDAVQVKLGMIATPWIGYEDKMNEHRYISKSFVDTHKMAASADAGVGIQGKVNMFSYDIVSINGGGYGSTGKTEKTDLETRFGVKPMKGLEFDLGYRTGYLGKFVAGTAENKNTLTQFLVSYGHKGDISYRIAANVIANKVEDQLTNTTVTEKGTEIWAMARSGDFGGYIRNESLDYGVVGKTKETRTVVSLDYHATKGVVLSLVSDRTSDVGGTAGSDKSTTGLFSQFKF
ncbi:porin [Ghiorsea bivora]|uniref:porin n=1 Tax=Ghiorsea bivora TaxID=1485545 RepID=UPI0005717B16|nr:porin [Ghiorsea bivora]